MRKRASRDEGEEIVTAWRVVKRRMAKGDSGGRRGKGSAGDGRRGRRGRGDATVYASRVG